MEYKWKVSFEIRRRGKKKKCWELERRENFHNIVLVR